MKELSVVIPCLNEEKSIQICIEKCKKVFKTLNIDGEVIVTDNGSTDKTVEIAKSQGIKVVTCNKIGYGANLRNGFSYAEGKFILMVDADNTYDILEVPKLYEIMISDENIGMVMGSRFRGYIENGAMPNLHRYFGTPFLTLAVNFLFGTRISDSQCGMRLLRKSVIDNIEFTANGMEFASELTIKIAKSGMKIKETPISLYKAPEGRKAHLRPWRDGFRHLFFMLKHKFLF